MCDDATAVTAPLPGDRGDRPRRRSSILKLPRAPLDEVDQNNVTETITRSKPAKRVSFSFTTDIKIFDRDILHTGESDSAAPSPAGKRAPDQTEASHFTTAKSNAKEDIISGLLTLPLKRIEMAPAVQDPCETAEESAEAKPRAVAFLASLRSLTKKEPEDAMALTMIQEDREHSLNKTAVRDVPMSITACADVEVPDTGSAGADDIEETCLNKSFGCFLVPDEEEEPDDEKENVDNKVSEVEKDADVVKSVPLPVMLQECQCNKKGHGSMEMVPLDGISPIHVAQKLGERLTGVQAACRRCVSKRQLLESTRIEEMENTMAITFGGGGSKEQRSFRPSLEPSLNEQSPVPHKDLLRGTAVPKDEVNVMEITHCASGMDVSNVVPLRAPGNTGLVPALVDASLGDLEMQATATTLQFTCNVSNIQDDLHSEPVVEGLQQRPPPSHTSPANETNHLAEAEKHTSLEPLSREKDIREQIQAEELLSKPANDVHKENVEILGCDLRAEVKGDENCEPKERRLTTPVEEVRSDCTSLCEMQKQDSRETEEKGEDVVSQLLVPLPQDALNVPPAEQCLDLKVCNSSKDTGLAAVGVPTSEEPALGHQTAPAVENQDPSKEDTDAVRPDGTKECLPVSSNLDGDLKCEPILPEGSDLTSLSHGEHIVANSKCQQQDEGAEDMETDEVHKTALTTTCSTMQMTCLRQHATEKTPSVGLVTLHCPNESSNIDSTHDLKDFKLEFTCQKENTKSLMREVMMLECDEPDRQPEPSLGSAMQLTCFQQTGRVTPAMPSLNMDVDLQGSLTSAEKVLQKPDELMELGTLQGIEKDVSSSVTAGPERHDVTTGPQQTSSLNITLSRLVAGRDVSFSASSKVDMRGRQGSLSSRKAPSSSSKETLYKFGSADAFRRIERLPDGSASEGLSSGRHVQRALFGEAAKIAKPCLPIVLSPEKIPTVESTRGTDMIQNSPGSNHAVAATVSADDHMACGTSAPPTFTNEEEHPPVVDHPMVHDESMPSFCDMSLGTETKQSFSASQCEANGERQRKSATFFVRRSETEPPLPKESQGCKPATFCVLAKEKTVVVASSSSVLDSEARDIFSSPLHKVARRMLKEDKPRTPTRIGWDYSKSPVGSGRTASTHRSPVNMIPRLASSTLKVRGSSSRKTRSQLSAEPTKGGITPTPMKARLRNASGSAAAKGASVRAVKHPREATPESVKKSGVSNAHKVAKLLSSRKKTLDNVPEERTRLRLPPGKVQKSSARKLACNESSAVLDAAFDTGTIAESAVRCSDSDSMLSGISKLPEISVYTATLHDLEKYGDLGVTHKAKKWLEKRKEPTPEHLLEQLYWTLASDPWEGREYVIDHLSEESAAFLFLNDRLALTVTLGETVRTRRKDGRCRRVESLDLRSEPLSTPCSRFLHKMFLKKANVKQLSNMCKTTDSLANVLIELNRVSAECRQFVEDFTLATRRCTHEFEEEGNLRIQFLSISKGLWFYLTFKIDVDTYPNDSILPSMEIRQALSELTSEKVNAVLGQVLPGKMYLSRMESALHKWLE